MRAASYLILILAIALPALFFSCAAPPEALPTSIPVGVVMPVAAVPAAGPNMIKAAELAILQFNGNGGINGKRLEWLEEDEGPTAATALLVIHKLIDEKKVQVILGGTTSEVVMGCGSYMAAKNVPLLSPSATSTDLSLQSWSSWVFRTPPDDALQGGVVTKLIKDRGYKKVATLVQDTVYGRGIEEMAKEFLKDRADVVISVRYDPAKLSYLSELNSIKDKSPDCVLHVGAYEDSAVIYRQAGELGMDNIPWFTADGVYDMPLEHYLEAAKFMEKAVTGTVPVPDLQSGAYKNFSSSYQTAYNMAPTVYCDTTFDGMNLIALAIKQANTYRGGNIRDALQAVGKDYHGVSGTITFNEQGSRIAGNYGVWKVVSEGQQYKFQLTGEFVSFLKPR